VILFAITVIVYAFRLFFKKAGIHRQHFPNKGSPEGVKIVIIKQQTVKESIAL